MAKPSFSQCMVIVLVAGSAFSPFASALGLLILLGHSLADKYFTSNLSDQDRADIAALKADLLKVKQSQQAQDLSKAFGNRP